MFNSKPHFLFPFKSDQKQTNKNLITNDNNALEATKSLEFNGI